MFFEMQNTHHFLIQSKKYLETGNFNIENYFFKIINSAFKQLLIHKDN